MNKSGDIDFEALIKGFFALIIAIIFSSWLIFSISVERGREEVVYYGGIVFSLMKILLLSYSCYILFNKKYIKYKYREVIVSGFLIYAITPLLLLTNFLIFNGESTRILVASQPFSVIAILQFTRVIYLRLVDKAFLRSRLKKSEEKYRHEKEVSRMKDGFISTVSHELRTPLTSISLYNDLLQKGKLGKISKKQKQALTVIKKESNRLTELINDVLDLSKLEAGKMTLNLKEFDLNEFFSSNPYSKMAEEKGLRLINKLNKKFIIKADEDKIRRAVINLISNAIKYSEKGIIGLDAKTRNGHYEIIVSDHGKGMAKEEIAKIFDKFYQVEDYITRQGSGTGLGLCIVNEIIKLHKGRIEVKSAPKKGSTFTLIIPKDL